MTETAQERQCQEDWEKGLGERNRRFEEALKRHGIKPGPDIHIKMRDCDDVPNFIRRVEEAHERTKYSKLRFDYHFAS